MLDLLLLLAIAVIVFAVHWVANDRYGGQSFRDWWRNQPTWRDPDRWERFKRERNNESAEEIAKKL